MSLCKLETTITVIEDGKEYEVRIYDNGAQWFLNGITHREKGPACYKYNDYKWWLQNGRWHRLDGPAIIWSGSCKNWWINCIDITKEQHTKVRTMLVLGLDKI